MPLFAAILVRLILHEAVRLRTGFAIAVGFVAIATIFAEKLRRDAALGDLFAVMAALLFAANLILIRKHPETPLLPPLVLSGLLGTAIAGVISSPLHLSARDIAILVASGAFQQTAGLALFLWGARVLPPAEIGLLAYIETVFGPLWVWLVLGERPSTLTLIGGVIVILTLVVHARVGIRDEPVSF